MNINKIFALAAMALPISAAAQGEATHVLPNIQFETQDYVKLGVYDTWEESPFRINKFANPGANAPLLQGHVQVTGNFLNTIDEQLGKVVNPSTKILAVQRSIYGSNTFGARIDLQKPFELTPQVQYLHVMVNRPYSGRVMVVGLGKRQNNPDQSKETEQFWAMSLGDVPADKWYDVVLPIKGNGGIDIHSLVVVPDCESPLPGAASQMCYIDNICVNNDPRPAFVYDYYPISFDKGAEITRNDRYLSGVGLQSADGDQNVVTKNTKKLAYNKFEDESFKAVVGETVTPKFAYTAKGPMFGYVYVDWDQNGRFEDNELMSSARAGGNNAITVPAFKVPEGQKPGNYYMRYKVDWDNTDPAGSVAPGNELVKNGGGIMDIRLNVHGATCKVTTKGLNGDLFAINENGQQVELNNYQVKFGQSLHVRIVPANGFTYDGIAIKHGYKLSGQEVEKNCRQWAMTRFGYADFDEKNELVIPASCLDGEEIEIENFFVEKKAPYTVSATAMTSQMPTGYYLVKGTSDKGTGYVYSDGTKLMVDTQVQLSGVLAADKHKYLWKITNDGLNHFQLHNFVEKQQCFGNGDYHTQQMGITEAATYTLGEVTPGFLDGKWSYMQTTQGGKVTYVHMNSGGKLGYWDSNNTDSKGSLSLFQFFPISGVPMLKVTYNYQLDGKTVHSSRQVQEPYAAYAAEDLHLQFATQTYANEGKVTEDGQVVNVVITENLPFNKSVSVEDAHWYFLSLSWHKDNNWGNSRPGVVCEGDATKVALKEGGYTLADNTNQWCFVGNVLDGFKVYNRNAHKKMVTTTDMKGNNGSENNVYCKEQNYVPTASESDSWFISPSTYKYNTVANGFTAESTGFFMGVETDAGVKNANKQNGKMVFWTGGQDGGSTFYVNQVVPAVSMTTYVDNSYASLYLPFAAQLGEGVGAFFGELQGDVLKMHEIAGGYVPAYTGVVLKAANTVSSATLTIAKEKVGDQVLGDLKGTNTSLVLNDANRSNYWVLGIHPTDGIGFYHLNAASLAANKAFLESTAAGVNGFRLDFDAVTGIEGVEAESEVAPAIYDLSGRRVVKAAKGLYIVNGKKVYVK